MLFKPVKTMFGAHLVTTRDLKVKPKDFDYLQSWRPFIDRRTMKIGFEHIDSKLPTIPAQFDRFTISGTDTIITNKNNIVGIITRDGEVFQPEFTSLSNYGKYAVVTHGTLKTPSECGVIELDTGKYTIPPVYRKITPSVSPLNSKVIETFCAEYDDNSQEILTPQGKVVVPRDAQEVDGQLFDLNTVYTYFDPKQNAYVLVDNKGNQMLKTMGEFSIHHDVIIVSHLGGSRVFAKGETGLLQDIMHSPDGRLTYLGHGEQDGERLFKQEIITSKKDAQGQPIKQHKIVNQFGQEITPAYQDVAMFDDDYFKIQQDDHWGLVDRQTGEIALEPTYEELLPLYNRPNFAKKDGFWGVLGKGPQFKEVVPFEYTMNAIHRRHLTMDATNSQGQEVSIEIGKNRVHVSTYNPTQTDPIDTQSFMDTYQKVE